MQLDTVVIKTSEAIEGRKRYRASIAQLREEKVDLQRRLYNLRRLQALNDVCARRFQRNLDLASSDSALVRTEQRGQQHERRAHRRGRPSGT